MLNVQVGEGMSAIKCDTCGEYKPHDEFQRFTPQVTCDACESRATLTGGIECVRCGDKLWTEGDDRLCCRKNS